MGLAEPVVSPVTAPDTTSSAALPAGHRLPVASVAAPTVVVWPFFHLMVPPLARALTLIFFDLPPVFLLHVPTRSGVAALVRLAD